jgi:hypothetical protein
VVIKCSVGDITALSTLRALWPGTPCVILIRNPLEVLMSNCTITPQWLYDWYRLPAACWFGTPPQEVMNAGAVEFCAWVIGRFCEEATAGPQLGCRVLDYSMLTRDTVREIASSFGLEFTVDGLNRFKQAFECDAKDNSRRFDRDNDAKRKTASAAIVRVAERWISPAYNRLLAHATSTCD